MKVTTNQPKKDNPLECNKKNEDEKEKQLQKTKDLFDHLNEFDDY